MNDVVYVCGVCENEFIDKRGLRKHNKKFHPELFKYKCEICGDLAEDLKGLMIHVAKVHDAKEYFDKYLFGKEKCKYIHCDNNLTYENRYSGNYCCQGHYESQKKINDGIELKYKCELCNTMYEDLGGLKQHLSKVHNFGDEELKNYYDEFLKKEDEGFCKYCGKELGLSRGRFTDGYSKFCHNTDCNVLWHNENTDRLDKFSESLKETIKDNPERFPVKLEYWIAKGYPEKMAKAKLSERQTTFSKSVCVEKHGEEKGIEIWKERQRKWQCVLDSKPDEEKMRINRLKAYSSGCISNAERELCEILDAKSSLVISSDVGYVYDIHKNNKIIEYNGDYWHCNPKKYNKDYFNARIRMTAEEKWKKDEKKIQYAKDNGYDVLIIWEDDYNKDKQKVINDCLEFING